MGVFYAPWRSKTEHQMLLIFLHFFCSFFEQKKLTQLLSDGMLPFMKRAEQDRAGLDDYRSLLVLDEIARNGNITQRDLSNRLGIALGLVNSYIKNLAIKGYITISTIPRKRYRYYLTPKGFKQKARLACEHLKNFTNLYRRARRDFRELFRGLESRGIRRVALCGVDEIAEIAYLSSREVNVELVGIVDDDRAHGRFFDYQVLPIAEAGKLDAELFIVTSFRGGVSLSERLRQAGIDADRICDIGEGDWLNKITTQGV